MHQMILEIKRMEMKPMMVEMSHNTGIVLEALKISSKLILRDLQYMSVMRKLENGLSWKIHARLR